MIIHKLLVTVCFVALSLNSYACDICGNYMGIIPYDNKNSISFLHRYRVFNGYKDYQSQGRFFPKSAYKTMHGANPIDSLSGSNVTHSSKDFESYKIFELRCKYFVLKRLEVNVFLPLLSNKSKTDDDYTTHTGFGDLSFNAGYHILIPKIDKKYKQKLILGVGIKLPSGNYYAHDSNSNRLPFEMQPGTGSTDGFIYINYVMMTKNIGANVNLNYKINGTNRFKEKLCNSNNDFFSIFYKIKLKKLIFYPSIQANYEFTKGLMIKNKTQDNTGVNSLLVGPGIDVYFKSVSFNIGWQFTAFEQVTTGNLKSIGRINLGLNYNFVKTNKSK